MPLGCLSPRIIVYSRRCLSESAAALRPAMDCDSFGSSRCHDSQALLLPSDRTDFAATLWNMAKNCRSMDPKVSSKLFLDVLARLLLASNISCGL